MKTQFRKKATEVFKILDPRQIKSGPLKSEPFLLRATTFANNDFRLFSRPHHPSCVLAHHAKAGPNGLKGEYKSKWNQNGNGFDVFPNTRRCDYFRGSDYRLPPTWHFFGDFCVCVPINVIFRECLHSVLWIDWYKAFNWLLPRIKIPWHKVFPSPPLPLWFLLPRACSSDFPANFFGENSVETLAQSLALNRRLNQSPI